MNEINGNQTSVPQIKLTDDTEKQPVTIRPVNYVHNVFRNGRWEQEAWGHTLQYRCFGDTEWREVEVATVEKERDAQ